MTYDAVTAQVGLTRSGVFGICKRIAERDAAGRQSGQQGFLGHCAEPPTFTSLIPPVSWARPMP
jgi:hypothetical protein